MIFLQNFSQRLADKVIELYDNMLTSGNWTRARKLSDLHKDVYRDSDIPSRLPDDLQFSPWVYFSNWCCEVYIACFDVMSLIIFIFVQLFKQILKLTIIVETIDY